MRCSATVMRVTKVDANSWCLYVWVAMARSAKEVEGLRQQAFAAEEPLDCSWNMKKILSLLFTSSIYSLFSLISQTRNQLRIQEKDFVETQPQHHKKSIESEFVYKQVNNNPKALFVSEKKKSP